MELEQEREREREMELERERERERELEQEREREHEREREMELERELELEREMEQELEQEQEREREMEQEREREQEHNMNRLEAMAQERDRWKERHAKLREALEKYKGLEIRGGWEGGVFNPRLGCVEHEKISEWVFFKDHATPALAEDDEAEKGALSLEIRPFEKLQKVCADKNWKVSRIVDELIDAFLTEIGGH